MTGITQPSLLEIRSLLTQMLGNARDQVAMLPNLSAQVRALPPPNAELLSSPRFDRAALQTYVANFFRMPEDLEQGQQIRISFDSWIRGVSICVLPALEFEQAPDAATWENATALRALLCHYGTLWRGLVDVRWRIEDDQGFISDGIAAVTAPASQLAGDGEFSAPLDWRLNREQQINVTCINRLERVVDPECPTYFQRTLPWVAVAFWAERV